MKKRILALILSLVLALSMSFGTLAEEIAPQETTEAAAVTDAAQTVADMIDAIGTVTPSSGEAIAQAQAAYDALSDEEKAFVSNIAALQTAAEAYAALTEAEETEEDEPTVQSDAAAASAQVLFSVSKDGSLELADAAVTVQDVNEDGILTYDEALIALHKAYCKGGYATEESTYGTLVTKFWGVETINCLFFKNHAPLEMNVGDTSSSTVSSGDILYAALLKDTSSFSDWYTYFDEKELSVKTGESFTLSLTGFMGMSWGTIAKSAVGGAAVGTWCDGVFTPVAETDGNGSVTLQLDEAGTYVITAEGSVGSSPIMPPVCRVTVSGSAVLRPSIALDQANLTLLKGQTAELTATTENVEGDITWASSNESVVTVSDGRIQTVGIGTATVTAKIGSVQASCAVKVIHPTLSSLEVYTASDSETALTLDPAFGSSTEYSVTVPDYTDELYLVGILSDETNACCGGSMEVTLSAGKIDTTVDGRFAAAAAVGKNAVTVQLGETVYTVSLNKTATLSALSLDGTLDGEFNRDKTSYLAYVSASAQSISLTCTAYGEDYSITVNDTAVPSGQPYDLPVVWDGDGRMTVTIAVSGKDAARTQYILTLQPMPQSDAPTILVQPQDGDYTILDGQDDVTALSVEAVAKSEISYQWYEDDTPIEGATSSSYLPDISAVGTRRYYCVLTADGRTVSDAATVTVVDDPTPSVRMINIGETLSGYDWDKGYVYTVGDTNVTALEVEASSKVEGGTMSYQWYSSKKAYDFTEGNAEPCSASVFTPSAVQEKAGNSGLFYACRASYLYKGRTYTAWSVTGDTVTVDGAEVPVNGVYVYVRTDAATAPSILTQPASAAYILGDEMSALFVEASLSDGGTLGYQWYVSDTGSFDDAEPIEGAANAEYDLGTAEAVGTKYYACIVTNTLQEHTASASSSFAAITVSYPAGVVGDRLKGSGTAEDPYLIEDVQDYQDVYDLVAEGYSFEGMYLKQVNDITLPDGWQPIGKTKDGSHNIQSGENLLPFSGTLDGGDHTLTVPEGGLPLLGYVKGAKVENLNIYGKKIAGYGLVEYLEGVGMSGEAICIDNVTLKSGTSTLKSGLIGTYLTTNPYSGCSSGFYVTIRNCTAESGVVIGYNQDQTMIGSFAGRINGTISNCTSAAQVYGKDYVGGILGSRDNALGDCTVRDCTFTGSVTASGEQAGGIVGGGYSDYTAPNGIRININSNSVTGSVTGADKVGGILGADIYVAQAWNAYTFKNNSFTGKVRATGGSDVGGIIGYYDSLNMYDDISGNYYSADCGAEKGIGRVLYVDTDADHETDSGATYFDTSKGTSDCPTVAGCNWRRNHNRSDDPLGKDAAKLTYTDSQKVEVERVSLSKTTLNLVAGRSAALTATVSPEDATDKTVTWSSSDTAVATVKNGIVTAVGAGTATVTAKAGDVTASCKVTVTKSAGGTGGGGQGTSAASIEISGTYKMDYAIGDKLNLDGMTFKVVYTDGSFREVSAEDVTIEGFDSASAGTKTVTVKCEGASASFTVTVSAENVIHVTLSILGDGKHGSSGTVHTYAAGNLTTWVKSATYTVEKGSTVWQVLKKCLDEKGYSYSNSSGNYVAMVRGLSEFDNGKNSGWMYILNGKYPLLGVSEQTLKDGDKIIFHYTDDYTKENDGFDYGGDEEEKKSILVQAVEKLIGNIGTVTYTDECKKKIDAARTAYDKLTYAEKKQVENYAVLTAAEKEYAAKKAADDAAKASEVEKLIDAIEDPVTLSAKTGIDKARKAYDALTDAQKARVGNIDKLTSAEYDYANLIATDEDRDAAKSVIDMIDDLGDRIASADAASVQKVRKAYDALTDEQKALVTDYARLERAEKAIAKLSGLGDYEEVYRAAGEKLESMEAPAVGGEWRVIGLARSGREVDEAYSDSIASYIEENMDEDGRLHPVKASENARVILALTALDQDATDLLAGLDNMEYIQGQGLYGSIYTLLALDSGDYETAGDADREVLIQVILDAQLEDGGWALAGEEADAEITAFVIQALAPYYDHEDEEETEPQTQADLTEIDVNESLDAALDCLSILQLSDGSFGLEDGEGSIIGAGDTTAQVIIALTALQIDPEEDERFTKNGASALDALLGFYVSDGSFKRTEDSEIDDSATEQAYLAMTAYARLLMQMNGLYDMRDAEASLDPETWTLRLYIPIAEEKK